MIILILVSTKICKKFLHKKEKSFLFQIFCFTFAETNLLNMNIEKEIYKQIVAHAAGENRKVLDLSTPTLRRLRQGKGETSIFKVFDLLLKNGFNKIKLCTEHTELVIDADKREIITSTVKK